MSDIAKAYVQIVPSAKGIKGSISHVLGGEAEAAGSSAGAGFGGNLLGKVKGMIAAAGLGKALSASFTGGGELEQSLGGVKTLFKASADSVIASARAAYATAGMDANAYMEMVTDFSASLIASLGGDTAAAAAAADQALRDMSDNANKMGTDMALIQNAYQGFAKGNYTMLDNLKLGYGGTKTEMERLLARAQELSGVKYDINNLSDVYSAIHEIQKDLGIAGATAKEAATTLTGSFSAMKAAAKNVLGGMMLGEDIKPSLQQLRGTVSVFLKDNLLPMAKNLLKGLPDILNAGLSAAIDGMHFLKNNSDAIVETGLQLVQQLGESVMDAIPSLVVVGAELLGAFGRSLLNADWAAMGTTLVQALKSSVSVNAMEVFGQDLGIADALRAGLDSCLPLMLEGGASLLSGLLSGIAAHGPSLIAFAGTIVGTLATSLIDHLPQMLDSGKSILQELLSGIGVLLPQAIVSGGQLVIQLVSGIVRNLPQILASGVELVVTLIKGIGETYPKIIDAAASVAREFRDTLKGIDWLQLGKDVIGGIIDGFAAMGSALWEAATSIARTAMDAITDFFEIRSPSRRAKREAGIQVPAGVAEGMLENAGVAEKAARELSRRTSAALDTDLAVRLSANGRLAYSGSAPAASGGEVVALLAAILQAIRDGNFELVQALLASAGKTISERDFARMVKAVST